MVTEMEAVGTPFFTWIILITGFMLGMSLAFFSLVLFLHARNDAREERWRDLEARWENTLLDILAGEAGDSVKRIQVEEKHILYFLHYLLRFHKTLSGDERVIIRNLAAPFLHRVAPKLKSRHAEIRARAVITLGALGMTRHETEILDALDDASDLVAMQAAVALAGTGNPGYLPRILSRFGRYRDWSSGSLVAMLASSGPASIPILRRVFEDPARPSPERAIAALTLMELDDYTAEEAAIRICASEKDPALLAATLSLIGKIGGAQAIQWIRPHRLSKDPGVRLQALRAMGKLGDKGVWDELLASMTDECPQVRIEAGVGMRNAGAKALLAEIAKSGDSRSSMARHVLEMRT